MDQDWFCENCRTHRLSEEEEVCIPLPYSTPSACFWLLCSKLLQSFILLRFSTTPETGPDNSCLSSNIPSIYLYHMNAFTFYPHPSVFLSFHNHQCSWNVCKYMRWWWPLKLVYFGRKSHGSHSRRAIRSIRPATRSQKTRYRLNRTVHSSGTRMLIRIMNAFEKRARKEAWSGSRANYRFEASKLPSIHLSHHVIVGRKLLRFFFWFVFVFLLMVERIGVGW